MNPLNGGLCRGIHLSPTIVDILHFVVLLMMATLTLSSGGLRLEGRWIWGNQGMST